MPLLRRRLQIPDLLNPSTAVLDEYIECQQGERACNSQPVTRHYATRYHRRQGMKSAVLLRPVSIAVTLRSRKLGQESDCTSVGPCAVAWFALLQGRY
ncbi:hypothetical protein Y1Q_0010343 [Alligator mississippiensis]|uniref:Uncharacterized protein n=1 Tax=Alligator mississippiensis TaxID=8496 RepID=A0A151NM56_ALLMI|nr:hypothetical protein Y1Q_0010343 [Alligator mississippiensis]